jgi:molybdopterin synthase sulfur carrier subunit
VIQRINVQFFATFRHIFGTKGMEIAVETGTDIGELLNLLFNTQERRKKMFDNGKVKPYIIIFKNGRHIQHFNGLETEIGEGDTISIFPPIAGG